MIYKRLIQKNIRQITYLNKKRPSEAVNRAHVHQYNLRRVASMVVLTHVGLIDGRGWPLKCFLILLSD